VAAIPAWKSKSVLCDKAAPVAALQLAWLA
jgi:hypothetical protein